MDWSLERNKSNIIEESVLVKISMNCETFGLQTKKRENRTARMCESKQILVYSKIVLLKVSVCVQSTFKSFLRDPTIIVLKNIHQKCIVST